ncbi:hypothetical protein MIN45_P1469 [Methylomarinovum tepidoasis]|uniref:DUF3592 domain-containing protein n=1 Tax=Methylomarinovum tepidoasis TaxID=2840183 RepID=A0AAU9CYJ3_9GAMM|nr:DUF3592 domain-containing protein [Methylomarinovum sp. IN45]BCX89099.1 hypothetical protein MIN45_P1469 [Methylomarinovum sp. IN45]
MTSQLLATLIAGVLVVGIAVALAIYVIRHYVVRSATWRKAPGRIVATRLDAAEHPRTGARLFGAHVSYEYQVGGRTYHGHRINPDYIYTNREAFHREILKRYQEGKQVTVYYNPKNPTEAYLELGIPKVLLALMALAVVFMLTVFAVLVEMVAEYAGAGQ